MIKVILFDCDGLIVRHEKYFSIRLAADRGLSVEDESKIEKEFFNGVFLECEIGKADLKAELSKNLNIWRWQGTVESLMDYWFSGEAHVENELKDYVLSLRKKSIRCFLCTNNEKYRSEYLWNVAGLKNVFDGVFPSCDIGCFKEDRVFWEKVYKNFSHLNKKDILVWDDDKANVESAARFNLIAEHYDNFESFKKIMKEKHQIAI